MKSNKLVRQIRREAKSHPAKAAILGILAIVAVCYWASLAWSWVGDGKGKCAKSAQANAKSSEGIGLPNSLDPEKILAAEMAKNAKTQADKSPHDWKQVVEWIESDPRTVAIDALPGRADAFEIAEKPTEQEKKREDKPKPVVRVVRPDPTPQQLDMELSSTLVGSDGGVALINGKTYRIGHAVISEKDQHQTPFTLSEIHARYVLLKHKDKQYKLFPPEKKPSGNVSITIKK